MPGAHARDGNVRVDLDSGQSVTCGPHDVAPLCEVSQQPACSRCMRFLGAGESEACTDELQCERRRRREARVAQLLAEWYWTLGTEGGG